jgi:hypothetical protein
MLTLEEKAVAGARIAEVLMMRKEKETGRWLTSWGTKTDLGVYEVAARLVKRED